MALTLPALWRALLASLLLACGALAQDQTAVPANIPAPRPLSGFPNCQGAAGSTVLPAGLKGCQVTISGLKATELALFTFSLAATSDMTVNIRLTTLDGTSQMGVMAPGETFTNISTVAQDLFNSEGHHYETAAFLAPTRQPWGPGMYTILVQVQSRQPMMTLTVTTTANNVLLHPYEQSKMSEMFAQCCPNTPADIANAQANNAAGFCSFIAPRATEANHTWEDDLCHQPYNECDGEGRLMRLNLQTTGLVCRGFPSALGELTALESLDLSANNINATIEDAAAVLATKNAPLKELYLYEAGLSGPLDCGIVASPRTVLDLRNNVVTGPVPECLFTSTLTEAHLGGNALGGPLPEVSGPSNLTALFAENQRGQGFTGAIPASLSGLETLQYLDLSNSALNDGFAGPISDSVVILAVPFNNMTGSLPNLPRSAIAIDLRGNLLGGELPDLAPLQQLEAVYASGGNSFTGMVSGLPDSLRVLELRGNKLSGDLPALPPNLAVVSISGNSFTGDISKVNFTGIQTFLADNQQFTGGLSDTVATALELDSLSMQGSGIGGALPQDWNTPALSLLDLSDNALTGPIPPSLSAQPQLTTLDLTNNQLSGNLNAFAAAVMDSSPLVNLTLNKNQLTGSIPAGIQKIGVFRTAPIIIADSLAGALGVITGVATPRTMDLSDNQLSGTFPSFLVTGLAQAFTACRCNMLIGVDATLTCPSTLNVTDAQWEFAGAGSTFYCTDPSRNALVPITNYLISPSHTATNGVMDAGARRERGGDIETIENVSSGGSGGLSAGGIAGVVVAAVVVSALVAGLLVWVQKRRRAYGRGRNSFTRQTDQPTDLAGHAAAVSGLPTSKSLTVAKDAEMGQDTRAVL